jgi:hypothetical protein
VEKLSDETLAAVGRLTVATVELEAVLAGMAGERAEAVFVQPGEALRAAREAVAGREDETAHLVEAAATQLAVSQSAVRAMWRGGRTDAPVFDEIATLVLGCAERLQARAR